MILRLKLLGCKDRWNYDFIDALAEESMLLAWGVLGFLDCLDARGETTSLGRDSPGGHVSC